MNRILGRAVFELPGVVPELALDILKVQGKGVCTGADPPYQCGCRKKTNQPQWTAHSLGTPTTGLGKSIIRGVITFSVMPDALGVFIVQKCGQFRKLRSLGGIEIGTCQCGEG
jgi:hypothetical protein